MFLEPARTAAMHITVKLFGSLPKPQTQLEMADAPRVAL